MNQPQNQPSGFPSRNNPPPGIELSPLSHRSSRRAYFHDYRAPGFYHLTATVHPGSAPLSIITSPPPETEISGMIIPTHTPLGEKIKSEILSISRFHPEMRILRFVIMPDHLHIVLHVQKRLRRKLGSELAGFFGACSKHNTSFASLTEFKTLFQPFHDQILFDSNQVDRAIKYVEDNPRRLLLKRKNPDLFRRYLHLVISDHEYAAYGNIFLLKEIYLLPIRIHRRWTDTQVNEYTKKCLSEIEQGAVPISPFIHPAEKAIMNKAIETGARIIKLSDQGFEARFKPKGRDFDLCSEGRLLLLAPWPANYGRKSTAGYHEFHTMNDLAMAIATLPSSTRFCIRNPSLPSK